MKTADVLTILQVANETLAGDFVPDVGAIGVSPNVLGRAYRRGIASMVSTMLHKSGDYAGFRYLEPYRDGATDESRRFYYLSPRLARLAKLLEQSAVGSGRVSAAAEEIPSGS